MRVYLLYNYLILIFFVTDVSKILRIIVQFEIAELMTLIYRQVAAGFTAILIKTFEMFVGLWDLMF